MISCIIYRYISSIIAIIIVAINFSLCYLHIKSTKEDKVILIDSGSTIRHIGHIFKREDIIHSEELFTLLAKLFFPTLKTGKYHFRSGSNILNILTKISSGDSILYKIIIIEGLTIHNVIKILKSKEGLSGELNEDISEGSIMPSTYLYRYGEKRSEILAQMSKEMSQTLDNLESKLSSDSPLKNKHDILALASIVEKETALDDERKIIASVFINRLKLGMKLQSDPTVIYAITKGEYKLNRALSKNDLKIISEYNTYHKYGLPIDPICCPGKASLEAVIYPAITNYLYFVSNGKKGHNFSTNLKDHNKYVKQFRKTN